MGISREVDVADVRQNAVVAYGASAGANGKAEAESEGEDHGEGVLATLRHKMLRISTMTPSLRLFTGVAAGQMLAVALLIALHPWLGGMIGVGEVDHQPVQMPLVIFVIAVLFLCVAWSLLLAGAFAGHWILRAPVLAVFSYVILEPPVPTVAEVARVVLLVVLWGWAIAISLVPWIARRGGWTVSAILPPAATRIAGSQPLAALGGLVRIGRRTHWIPAFAALLGAFFVTLLASEQGGQGNVLFPGFVTLHLELLTFFLSPVLFLAGSDFVELTEVATTRVVGFARVPRMPWIALSLATLFALYIVWQNVFGGLPIQAALTSMLAQAAIAAVIGAVLIGIVRWAGVGAWRAAPIPFLMLLLVTVGVMGSYIAYAAYYVTHTAPTSLLGPQDYTIYRSTTGQPAFSFAYPKTWEIVPSGGTATAGYVSVLINGNRSPYPAVVYVAVVAHSAATPDGLAAASMAAFCKPGCQGAPKVTAQGAWRVATISTTTDTEGVWTRSAGSQSVIFMVEASSDMYPLLAPTFRDMAGTWRLDTHAVVPATSAAHDATDNSRALALAIALPGVLGVLVGWLLLAAFRRRGGRWAVGGLFALIFGIVMLVGDLSRLLAAFGLPSGHLGFSLTSVQLAVALATLGVVGWLVARRGLRWSRWTATDLELLSLLLVLALGVQAVLWFVALFDASMAVKLSVAQGIILIAGMGWDLLMSGEQITNVNGRAFPRHARVLLYLGYMVIVATAVLFFSSQSYVAAGHGAVAPFFDDDSWPQQGLLYLGLPVLLTGFVLEVSRWWARLRGRGYSTPSVATEVAVAAPGVEPPMRSADPSARATLEGDLD